MTAVGLRLIGHIPVDLVAVALIAKPELWREEVWRQEFPGTAHGDTESIYLRMPASRESMDLWASLEVEDLAISGRFPFRQLLDDVRTALGGHLARAMLVRLRSGGRIDPHTDEGPYAEATERYHLAIRSPPDCWLRSGSERQAIRPGELWWFNKHQEHSAWNDGGFGRVHLIVDTWRAGA